MVQPTMMNRFSQMINLVAFGEASTTLIDNRITIAENQHIVLPTTVTSIRVLSGKAWVSYMGSNIVVKTGETMEFEMGRGTAVVTSVGYKPVKIEMIQ